MFSTNPQSLKFALLLFSFSFIAFTFSSAPVFALNIGVQAIDATVSVSKECSRKCESDFCSVPPFLRYGKYCGLLYSGCPGEKPCDGLDACCMKHDACVQSKNRGQTFKGNTCQVDDVIEVISVVMKAALLAGRVLHKP
ncbi:phospholipase A2-alpha-like isoform X2 [Pistacia vera]|uniref:phospholipase A2-alpha-like isoform X2 n=1 Tax=Pistacia vera TaxID=55513 RepID=UPI001263754A|nr:phospholipase A2-alpha-like isoform X2 [Pistacia vera]XP_031286779.1 phospholipase A2-alpha-like isoform X2 [Pistacia vera]